MLKKVYRWTPTFPFYYGWAILVAAFFSTFAATSVAQVVLGGVQMYILEDTNWSKTEFSFTIACGTWISGFISPFIGKLADKYGPRQLMPAALILISLCYFGIYGIPAFWAFAVGYVISRTISQPILINVVPRTVTVNFFRAKRNIALSLVTMSRPVAGAINVQLIAFITQRYGWRTAYNFLGWFSLALSIPVFFIMRKKPEELGLLPDGVKLETTYTVNDISIPVEYSWDFKSAIRTKAFWFLAAVITFVTLSSSSVSFTLVPYYVEQLGMSNLQAASIFSLGTVLALSNLLWGILADKYSPRKILIFNLCIAGIMMLFLMNLQHPYQAWIFAILWGVFSGAAGTLEQMVIAQYFGRASYGTITGAIGPMQITALGLGPTLGALIRVQFDSYAPLYICIAILYVICAGLTLAAKPPVAKQLNP